MVTLVVGCACTTSHPKFVGQFKQGEDSVFLWNVGGSMMGYMEYQPDYPKSRKRTSQLENVRVRKMQTLSSKKFLEFTTRLPVCGPAFSEPIEGLLSFAGGIDSSQLEGEAHAVDLQNQQPCSKPYWFSFKKAGEQQTSRFTFQNREELGKFISSQLSS